MDKSLFKRFKEIYFSEFPDRKLIWSNFDKDGCLSVGVLSGDEEYCLNVGEYPNGEVYWY